MSPAIILPNKVLEAPGSPIMLKPHLDIYVVKYCLILCLLRHNQMVNTTFYFLTSIIMRDIEHFKTIELPIHVTSF